MSVTLFIATCIAVLAVAARRLEGTWVSPAVFLSAVWAGLVGAFALLFPSLDEYFVGSLWILGSCGAFVAGSLVARVPSTEGWGLTRADLRRRVPFVLPIVVAAIIVGVSEVAYLFLRRGASPFSLTEIVALVIANRAGNYGWAQLTQQPTEWFAFVALYAGALFGGMLFRIATRPYERLFSIASVILVALVFALYGSRFGALYGGSFWLSSYIATWHLTRDASREDARLLLRLGIVAVVILAGASVGTQVLRYWTQLDRIGWRSIFADGFSFVGAFSIWFREHGLVWSDFAWGARTFTKLVAPFGVAEPPLPSIDVAFTYSNIYTVFRDLLEDFGVVGALAFTALAGFVGRHAFEALRRGSLLAVPVAVLIYTFILTSFATSVFFYTAPTAALWAFSVFVSACAYRLPRSRDARWMVTGDA